MISKILIAIVSCHSRKDWVDAVCNTWLPLVPKEVDVHFFLGRGEPRETLNDEVFLDCEDTYQGLPEKVREITKWALEQGYDFVLKIDDDVVLNPVTMLLSGFDKHDYTGCIGHNPTKKTPYFVPGGYAYWLSRKCMELVSNAELPSDNNDEQWVASVLAKHDIKLHHDPRYYINVSRSVLRHKMRVDRLPNRVMREPVQGTFAWCIHFENHDSSLYSTEAKISEFNRVFAEEIQQEVVQNQKASV